MENKKLCYLECKKHCYVGTRNIVAWKERNLYLAILIVFCVTIVTWTFDQFESLFKVWHYVHCVPKNLKLIIDEFESYLMNKKQISLGNKLGYGFVHGYLKIRVLHDFACVWKVVVDWLKITTRLACEGKKKFKFGKSKGSS